MSLTEIQGAVAGWSEQERGLLAAWILKSLPPHSHDDAGAEGFEEAARRREELDSGQTRPLAADEFWDSLERDRASWK
ncbi:MAG: addiction module protein [Chloroflexi bacterium]|nr:addiction module protein [Chloroflexota bacterium]